MKKVYEMIFKEFCTIHMQIRIKEHPKYDGILNSPYKRMDEISQLMQYYIRATYPYISLPVFLRG